ncbi:MAG: LysR family transcriptional regulator [Ruminococcus sp.]|nr:LysR family transcriptional regulator [Ruminococcus sp.]
MELRVLHYFLAVVREQTVSAAAESLHLTQPTLSRQLRDLEDELGKKLFIRGKHKIELTEEGMLLRKRAEQILELVRRTENDISANDETFAGDIYISAGETDAVKLVARTASRMIQDYPLVHFHIYSGDGEDVLERLNKGLSDFGIIFTPVDNIKYNSVKIPLKDEWGILMRKDSPLAEKECIQLSDIIKSPLIVSRQKSDKLTIMKWLGKNSDKLNIVSTYNLVYNASVMVKENIGYALALDKLINVSGDSELCFRPLSPPVYAEMYFIWNKYQVMTKSAEKFLEYFRSEIEQY